MTEVFYTELKFVTQAIIDCAYSSGSYSSEHRTRTFLYRRTN